MVKISEVHPTLAHSMETTIRILEAAIELRKKEIANMEACMRQCQKVMADEVMPSNEHSAELQAQIADRMDATFALGDGRKLTSLQKAMQRASDEQHDNGGLDR